jgi:glycosyltransferase involved in cell wall biosynthesis
VISVVLPVYNERETVDALLASMVPILFHGSANYTAQ